MLTGPTASGKTQLALRVAAALSNATVATGSTHAPQNSGVSDRRSIEIISLDSIAVYRHMNIGTAKPSPEEQRQVPHHLIDVVDPDHEYSVAEYLASVHRRVDEIWNRGNRPMFVGGTPMYLKAILRGFDPGPPADESFRQSVMKDVEQHGTEALRKRLEQVDPLSAARIDPSDVRRMIRALEFAREVGIPISHRQNQFDAAPEPEEGLVFTIQTPRAVLHRRIETRVEQMFKAGLIDEIRNLITTYPNLSKTARTAVGYREVLESSEFARLIEATTTNVKEETSETGNHDLQPNQFDWSSVAEQVLFHTRRLARRQETWFRSFSEMRPIVTHLNPDDPTNSEPTARPIKDLVSELTATIAKHPIWTTP
ncbi:tRNA (adenosine(37)-N6)-dimethylallyltransferase MiaA [Rhodopirellula sallentina]|uniref:tRNA dimethylallyltransferase n=1 Tax=Rhodopirellula sallentina SM41 TaxID=1263870 RepID=M5TUC8_9BACT|nr:tRNA (adenosine(37)-N6)-dimethylallyltransferase MiaA [Rhodopirellula sallentina]EMI52664.1 tRNA delta(2)-isopentenylpyrophosphate transferase [Rhodopirellula sallentina SM41]